ncbi:hypothetical protein ODY08_21620, partial [Escherichia coli]|nr:hypothetical protein [Escherichia coli]
GTADRNRSHWSTSKTPSYTKSVSWQHHHISDAIRITSHITIKKIIFTSDARSKTVTLNTLKR